jgi:prepilin-type N-terminal cleavage/methylation domain-containing protein
MRRRGEAGVTLIEIMVVLVIVALLVAATYPILGNVLNVLVSKGAAEQVASAIRQARQYAITEGENRCIKFGALPVTRYEFWNVDCTSGTLRGGDTIGNGAAVVNPANLAITFDPVGRITPTTGSCPDATLAAPCAVITVDTQPTSCASTITVTAFGGVRVAKC